MPESIEKKSWCGIHAKARTMLINSIDLYKRIQERYRI